jgi:hypothetical protein
MTDYRGIEERRRETFNLRRPVALTFRAAPPAAALSDYHRGRRQTLSTE